MFKIVNKKRFFTLIAIVVLLIALSVWGIFKYKNRNNPENQEQIYEALVNIVDQKSGDPVEDARSSLKKGDVIAYFPEGHSWSSTEKNSYLIVKLKLKKEDAAKLMEAETKPGKEVELPSGSSTSKDKPAFWGQEKVSATPENKTPKDMGPRQETVRARKYFLDLPSFDVQKFWETQAQPFGDKVFSASIIDKK